MHRPTYVAESLDALNRPAVASAVACHPGWRVELASGDLVVHSDGAESAGASRADRAGAFLSVLDAAWRHPEFVRVRAADDDARAAVSFLLGEM
jgi:glycerol-1-phosphatase